MEGDEDCYQQIGVETRATGISSVPFEPAAPSPQPASGGVNSGRGGGSTNDFGDNDDAAARTVGRTGGYEEDGLVEVKNTTAMDSQADDAPSICGMLSKTIEIDHSR